MKRFEARPLTAGDIRKRKVIEVFAAIVRVLLTPIMFWYRLYLWVWDGSMFDN